MSFLLFAANPEPFGDSSEQSTIPLRQLAASARQHMPSTCFPMLARAQHVRYVR
ncbi:hypothetical protein IG631_19433 [Alternaria alternata]|nr:hypothetical protein IG631_19433 [Alternaria alternata]